MNKFIYMLPLIMACSSNATNQPFKFPSVAQLKMQYNYQELAKEQLIEQVELRKYPNEVAIETQWITNDIIRAISKDQVCIDRDGEMLHVVRHQLQEAGYVVYPYNHDRSFTICW